MNSEVKTQEKGKQKNAKWFVGLMDNPHMFFLFLCTPFLLISPYCLKNIYDIVEQTKANRPEYVGPCWADFSLMFITLPGIAIGKYLTFYFFSAAYERNLPKKYTGELREVKIEKGCENIFKTVYFTTISLYGYFCVLKQLPYENPIIENGEWTNYYINFPYVHFDRSCTYYCILNLTYHTESAIHLFTQKRNDFYEMFCHHSLTILLIGIAYICNYNNLAVMIMLDLDNSDIFIGAIRVSIDITKNKFIILGIYFSLMISWVYTRMIVFPYEITYKSGVLTANYATGRLTPHIFMTSMCCVLVILNYYWFYLLVRMGYRFISGKSGPVDLQRVDTHGIKNKPKTE